MKKSIVSIILLFLCCLVYGCGNQPSDHITSKEDTISEGGDTVSESN